MNPPKQLHGITIQTKRLQQYCKTHHIKKLSLFGSILRDDFRSDSDIDLLVEFEQGKSPGFFDLIRMQDQLSQFFQGKHIDLRTPNDLSRYFRKKVLAGAVTLYAGS